MPPRDNLPTNEISDAKLRKNIFREMGGDLSREIKRGYCTDAPGSIARLMEKAFRAGLELGADPAFNVAQTDTRRRMTEMDIPSLPRQQMSAVQRALNYYGYERRFWGIPEPEGLVFIMRPAYPGVPSTISRDQWMGNSSIDDDRLSNRVMNPYIKLGLFERPIDLGNGWKLTFMTEWGYEMFLTGETSGLDNRRPRASSTASQYFQLLGDNRQDLYIRAARKFGVMKSEPEPSVSPPAPRR